MFKLIKMLFDKDQEYSLTVTTGEEAAEIFIINGQFNRIASSIGKQCVFMLKTGLYSIKVRAGNAYKEKSVALFNNETINFDAIEFSSPAPLQNTGKTHEFHIGNAEENSMQVHIKIGQGSQIYIFSRNWTKKKLSEVNNSKSQDPSIGLTLRNTKDEILVDFGSPEVGLYNTEGDAWSACNVQLVPGIYCLCLETAAQQFLKQTIIASPDWQTQVFLLQRNYGSKIPDIRGDIANSSIFMSRIGRGFQSKELLDFSENPNLRLTEMTRQALVNNRRVLTEEVVDSMSDSKFNNPMLGIYGAHCLLLDKKSNKEVLIAIINNLRRLLVEPHADVEAIAIKLKLPSNYIFNSPPMLRPGWNYVLEATVENPGLVPENSIASEIAGQLWSADPWLIWGNPNIEVNSKKNLYDQLKKLSELESASIDTSNLAPGQVTKIAFEAASDIISSDIKMSSQPQSAKKETPLQDSSVKTDEKKIASFVEALGVPRAKIDSMLRNIYSNTTNETV